MGGVATPAPVVLQLIETVLNTPSLVPL